MLGWCSDHPGPVSTIPENVRFDNEKRSPSQELPDALDHPLGLGVGQFGVNGQGNRLLGRRLAGREIALAMPQVGETLLHVQRHRIVDLVANLLLAEVRLDLVAARHTDHKLVVYVAVAGHFVGELDDALTPCPSPRGRGD